MKTRHIPVLIMLLAGAVTIILDVLQHLEVVVICRDFVISIVCFFIIGSIAKVFLDKAFNPKEPEGEEEKEDFAVEGEEGEEKEDMESESEDVFEEE